MTVKSQKVKLALEAVTAAAARETA